MKKLFYFLAVALLVPGLALASVTHGDLSRLQDVVIDISTATVDTLTATAGTVTTLTSTTATVTTLAGGAATFTGDVTGDGGDQLNGFLRLQVAASTTALTAAQCGATVVSAGAAVQPLPEASTVLGCRYTFVCGTADDFDIDPADASDQIGAILNSVAGGTGAAITPSAGDEIRCTDAGASIILEATGANLWSPIGVGNGAWTDVN